MLKEHYSNKFRQYGAQPKGVDWGPDPSDHCLRLDRMLAVTELGRQPHARHSILDVGCGYGSLLDLMKQRSLDFSYTGIDLCEEMIETARTKHPAEEWIVDNILNMDESRRFDYVVCNGLLTQKLQAKISTMDRFLVTLVTKMFDLCNIGVAFNVMSTHVNHTVENLYYRNPAELIAWCMSQLTPRIRLDHAYPLFEYTIYLYRQDATGLSYFAHRGTSGK